MDVKKESDKFLLLLLCTDLFFIILHIFPSLISKISSNIYNFKVFSEYEYRLDRDLGLAESFMYVKELWIVLLFCGMTILEFELTYLILALLFMCILLDDMLMLHEKFGTMFGNYFGNAQIYHISAKNIGEFFIFGLYGVLLSSLLIFVYYRRGDDLIKRFKNIFILFIVLSIFGVFFDLVHDMFKSSKILSFILVILEDGGEMVTMSIICWYVFTLTNKVNNKNY